MAAERKNVGPTLTARIKLGAAVRFGRLRGQASAEVRFVPGCTGEGARVSHRKAVASARATLPRSARSAGKWAASARVACGLGMVEQVRPKKSLGRVILDQREKPERQLQGRANSSQHPTRSRSWPAASAARFSATLRVALLDREGCARVSS